MGWGEGRASIFGLWERNGRILWRQLLGRDVHCSWKQSFGGGGEGGSEGSLESRDMPLVGDVAFGPVAVGLGFSSGPSPLLLAMLIQFIGKQ